MVKRARFVSTKTKRRNSNIRKMPILVTAIDQGMSKKELGKILEKENADFAKSIEAQYYYESKKCQVCQQADNQDKLILCDRCDDAYHIYCMNPVLTKVPEAQWICQRCQQQIPSQQLQFQQQPEKDSKCTKCNEDIWNSFSILKRNKIFKAQNITAKNQNQKSLKIKQSQNQDKSVSSCTKHKKSIVHWSNQGIFCRYCQTWFHRNTCFNIRFNAINCETCERSIRVSGPKSHQQFVKYIQNSYEQAMETYQIIGIDDQKVNTNVGDQFRAKCIGLKIPPNVSDWRHIVQQQMSLHYALKSQGMMFVDGQVYNPNDLSISSNNAQSQKIINPLSLKDQNVFIEFKQRSKWGYCAPIEIMQDRKVGFYAKAIIFIPNNTILFQYAGEVISSRQSLKQKNDSIMSLLRTSKSSTSIDICPTRFGNASKFVSGINNKQKSWRFIQNVSTLRFVFNGQIRLIFFAKKDIKAGEILYINYNGGAFQQYPTEHFIH